MLASAIAQYETQTHSFLKSQNKLVAAKEGNLDVFDYKAGYSSYWNNSNSTKKRIVLHFTMGYLGGDLSTLTQAGNKVSVSYVIARSGAIYRLFPSTGWSYHTGPGTVGGNTEISSSSIGIEMSNMGYLDRSGEWMWSYVGTKYCKPADTSEFVTLPNAYRGKSHYVRHTAAQYAALAGLLPVLCNKHAIPQTFLPQSSRFDAFGSAQEGRDFRGICSHVNYRSSGKWDIGPAFDWARIGG